MIVSGYATVVFPRTDRSNPSPAVGIIPIRPKRTFPTPTGLPLYIHWKQWEEIVVPLFEPDETGAVQATSWRGTLEELGHAVTLMNDVVGPDGEVVYPSGFEIGLGVPSERSIGTLYACDPWEASRVGGRTSGYLNAISGILYSRAAAAGF
jgi:hypothetical protein